MNLKLKNAKSRLERRRVAGLQHDEDQARVVGRHHDLALVGLETQELKATFLEGVYHASRPTDEGGDLGRAIFRGFHVEIALDGKTFFVGNYNSAYALDAGEFSKEWSVVGRIPHIIANPST